MGRGGGGWAERRGAGGKAVQKSKRKNLSKQNEGSRAGAENTHTPRRVGLVARLARLKLDHCEEPGGWKRGGMWSVSVKGG